ncbi:hypothetical protein AB833_09135 [Chromatiales bacterium (ex Bugula neritina AB1)]|nr:hypothetical protein AB833_09135 [Chromatiales bacterium (ex Bugula neritina AB1)]
MTTVIESKAAAMIDSSRYPISDTTDAESLVFADKCRRRYQQTGLCMLPGFIKPEALSALAAEAASFSEKAYFCKSSHNAYLNDGDANVSEADVSNRQEQTFVGSVAYDYIPDGSSLKQLYQWDPLKDFIGHVLGKSSFYRFADPFGACSINVFVEGGEHGWHFDESEFTVTLMLQAPESGGSFEYVPQIRGLPEEKTIVGRVLDGDREGVVELPFTAGTLLIFGGNQTLHRVTRVSGERARLVPVLCYAEEPDLVNSEAVRQLFWGRSGAESLPQ